MSTRTYLSIRSLATVDQKRAIRKRWKAERKAAILREREAEAAAKARAKKPERGSKYGIALDLPTK